MFSGKRSSFQIIMALVFVLALVLSACGAPGGANSSNAMGEAVQTETMMEGKMSNDAVMEASPTEDAMMEEGEHDSMMGDAMATETMVDEGDLSHEAMSKGDSAMMSEPAFLSVPLREATSGELFTLADYEGKVVLVENMAIWCSTCFRQQQEVIKLHEALGERDDFVSVGLDIDPNEDRESLQQYTAGNGFDWTYAVAPREVAREIGEEYGAQFLNPPSAPMFIVDRHGKVHTLPFGIKSAEDLQKALDPYLSQGM